MEVRQWRTRTLRARDLKIAASTCSRGEGFIDVASMIRGGGVDKGMKAMSDELANDRHLDALMHSGAKTLVAPIFHCEARNNTEINLVMIMIY